MNDLYLFVGMAVVWALIGFVGTIIAMAFFYIVIRRIYCSIWFLFKILKYDLAKMGFRDKYFWRITLFFRILFKVDFSCTITMTHRDRHVLRIFDFNGIFPKQKQ